MISDFSKNLSILMPCHRQKENFLTAAINSVLEQSDGHWFLDIVTEQDSHDAREVIGRFNDPRIRVLIMEGRGFARNLNFGLKQVRTPFVTMLFSDDKIPRNAVSTWRREIEAHPEIDVFYGGRSAFHPDASTSTRIKLPQTVEREAFYTKGSPVRHPMALRASRALSVGGIDENFSLHAADDFDFPWTLLEAGASFRAVPEVLLEYRNHSDGDRLTTGVPIAIQLKILAAILDKHGVPASAAESFLERATKNYLVDDNLGFKTSALPAEPPIPKAKGEDELLPFVSVIVAAGRQKKPLIRCLAALARQNYPADRVEVIVAGKMSSRRQKEISEFFMPSAWTLGFFPCGDLDKETAREIAAKNTKGTVFAFVKYSSLPTPSWLRAGVKRWMREPRQAVIRGETIIQGKALFKMPQDFIFDNLFMHRESSICGEDFCYEAEAAVVAVRPSPYMSLLQTCRRFLLNPPG